MLQLGDRMYFRYITVGNTRTMNMKIVIAAPRYTGPGGGKERVTDRKVLVRTN